MASFKDESYSYGMDKLTYEIFSILENKFLSFPIDNNRGKVRILSVDAGDDCLLAAVSLGLLESSLRSRCNNPDATVADFFDVAAGSGPGGVLVAMLFTRGPGGKPLFSAEEALHFLTNSRNQRSSSSSSSFLQRLILRRSDKGIFGDKIFGGGSTLRDTLKPVLIPCYDLSTGAPFLFSRADAMETDAYDFDISRICAATCADRHRPVEVRSADGRTRIVAQGGRVAMSNPTAAAITHVLNNKQEFPFAAGVDDLLVLSLGSTGAAASVSAKVDTLKIAAGAAADTVDQAVATEFGDTENYVRVRDNLAYKNVQSSLFRGRRISLLTNAEKLEELCGKLVEEEERRSSCPTIPTVCIKQQAMSPKTSSATTRTSSTSTTASTDDSCGLLDIR